MTPRGKDFGRMESACIQQLLLEVFPLSLCGMSSVHSHRPGEMKGFVFFRQGPSAENWNWQCIATCLSFRKK